MNNKKVTDSKATYHRYLLILLLLTTNLSLAAPNLWTVGFLQGYAEYAISNEQNDVVSIACNESAGEDRDHGVTITLHNGQTYDPEHNHIEFVINDESYTVPPDSMIRIHAGLWSNFISAISKATEFEIYIDNKPAARFKPRAQNVQKTFQDLSCESKW